MSSNKWDRDSIVGLLVLIALAAVAIFVLYSIGSFVVQNLVTIAIVIGVILLVCAGFVYFGNRR